MYEFYLTSLQYISSPPAAMHDFYFVSKSCAGIFFRICLTHPPPLKNKMVHPLAGKRHHAVWSPAVFFTCSRLFTPNQLIVPCFQYRLEILKDLAQFEVSNLGQ